MDTFGGSAAVIGIVVELDGPDTIVEQGFVEEAGPFVQDLHLFAGDIGEPPAFVSVQGAVLVVVSDGQVEIDDAADEAGREDADGAQVEQVQAAVVAALEVAEMRVAVDDAVAIEGDIPGGEEGAGELVAGLQRHACVELLLQAVAVEPGHGEQAVGGQLGDGLGDVDVGLVRQHRCVETQMRGFALVVELLPQAGDEFLVDVVLADGAVDAVINRHRDLELAEIGFHRAGHVGILELAGDVSSVRDTGAVNLTKARRGCGGLAELGEAGLPVGAEFGAHTAADEGPAHRRGIGLKLGEFGGVLRRERVGNGREKLGHLHQGTLESAQDSAEVVGVGGTVGFDAEDTLAGEAGGDPADRTRGAGEPA